DQKEDAMSDLADQVAAVEGQKADLEQKINVVASEADSLYQEMSVCRRRLISSIALVGAIPLLLRG
ncbi:internal head protein, partial [Escherichia coli O26:H11 str. CVM10026]